ncbi:MAG: hypothetical protein ABUS79_20505 [Pseudomonadota bacterium]
MSMLRRKICIACAAAFSLAGCHGGTPSEIVVVVDTNLSAAEVDEVVISVAGSQTQTVDVPLNAPGAPGFPLTLGLVPAADLGTVTVSAVGKLRGAIVVQQQADTAFVDGAPKMLALNLLAQCVGVPCDSTVQPMTCNAGACASAVIPGYALSSWTGTAPPRPDPSPVAPIGGRVLWASGWHSCANEGGVLYCWGQNADGQIGDGTQRNASSRHAVMAIGDLAELASVGMGQFTTCACRRDGTAWCWGRNLEGELGTGAASATSTAPIQVPGITDCVQITGGANHSCVRHADGTVSCWGSNASGQLGQLASNVTTTCTESSGTKIPCLTSPAQVPNLSNVADIAAGEQHTCVRKTDRTVACWGDNTQGQLGDGTKTGRSAPAAVVGLGTDIVELAVGRFFSCARHATEKVSCWGGNGSGQVGDGTTVDATHPTDLAGLSDVLHLALGRDHGCVVRDSATVSCWGGNAFGQLGNGTTTSSLTPVRVTGLSDIQEIAVGSVHSCARSTTGQVSCWGENIVNEIGDGTTTNRWQPVSVAGFM